MPRIRCLPLIAALVLCTAYPLPATAATSLEFTGTAETGTVITGTVITRIVITGTVLSRDGKPLANATVDAIPLDSTFDQQLALLQRRTVADVAAHATTDPEGRYRLEMVEPGVWRLRVQRPGFVAMMVPMLPVANPVELPDVLLHPSEPASLSIEDAAGKPIAGASVTASTADRNLWSSPESEGWITAPRVGWSDHQGRLELTRARGERLNLWVHTPGRTEIVHAAAIRRGRIVYATSTESSDDSNRHQLRILEPDGQPHPAMVAFAKPLWPLGHASEDGYLTVTGALAESLALYALASDGRVRSVELAAQGDRGSNDRPNVVVATLSDLVTVTGRVIDPLDQPISGAIMWPGHSPGALVRTDMEGRFNLTVPARERSRVQAHAPGFLPQSTIFPTKPDAALELELELAPATSIQGRVTDPNGQPIAGARLTATMGGEPQHRVVRADSADARATSDTTGRFVLTRLAHDQSYTVDVVHNGYTRTTLQLQPETDPTQELTVVLRSGRFGFGDVVDHEDRPIAGIAVRAVPSNKGHAEGSIARAAKDSVIRSSSEGRFEISLPTTSTLDLIAEGPGYAPIRVRGLQVPNDNTPVDLGTLVMAPGESLQGRVVDINSQPISTANIWRIDATLRQRLRDLGPPYGDLLEIDPTSGSTTDGSFTVTGLDPSQPAHLLIDAPGFLPYLAADLPVPAEETLTITLHPAARVVGQVIDTHGEPVDGAEIQLESFEVATDNTPHPADQPTLVEVSPRTTSYSAISDAAGRFVLENLPPGRAEAEAFAVGFQASSRQSVELALDHPDIELQFVLVTGATLEGQVFTSERHPIHNARVNVGKPAAQSDADGWYRVAGIPSGLQMVEVRAQGYSTLRREIDFGAGGHGDSSHGNSDDGNSDHIADFELVGGFRVTGTVVDTADRPLPGITLELGPPADGSLERSAPAMAASDSHTAQSDDDGSFRFEPVADGAYRLRVAQSGYVETERVEVRLDGASQEGLELRLQIGTVIEGRILGLDFDDLAQVEVRAEDDEQVLLGEVDFEGNYQVADLKPGDWTIEARLAAGGRQARARASIEPGDARLQRDLEFGAGLVLTGVVMNADTPLPETSVTLRPQGQPLERSVTTDHEGRFQIEDLEQGTYHVGLANHRLRLIHNEDLQLFGDRDVVLAFATTRISGTVVDQQTGDGIAEAMVVLRQFLADGRPGSTFTRPTEEDGSFELADAAAGSYRVEILRNGYQAGEQTLDAPSGATLDGLRFELEPAAGLEVMIGLASGGRPEFITLHGRDTLGRTFAETRRSDSEGYARFSSLSAGQWQLTVGGTGGAPIEVQATIPSEPLALVLPDAGRLRVRVPALTETDSLATLTVVDIEGRPFRQLKWGGALVDRWTVQAGRATIDGVPAGAWTLQVEGPSGQIWRGSTATTGRPEVEVSLE